MKRTNLPNFLVVGAAKSGTTSLYEYLSKHSEIFVPTPKEPYFLIGEKYQNVNSEFAHYVKQKIKEFNEYQEIYKNSCSKKAIGDFSAAYLYFYESTIKNIKKYIGLPKILIILRDPSERAYSNYLHHVREGNESESFETALKLIDKRMNENWWWGYFYKEAGLYYEQVKAYLENFSQVKIFLFEDLESDAQKVVDETCSFLDVPAIKINANKIYNKTGIPRKNLRTFLYNKWIKWVDGKHSVPTQMMRKTLPHNIRSSIRETLKEQLLLKSLNKPKMNPETRKMLIEYYREDILKLQELINRDLTNWLK